MTVPDRTPRAFSGEEYDQRLERVRAEMTTLGIDVLFVANPANIVYLSGYEACWYSPRLPLGLAIARHPASLVFFDWSRHRAYAQIHARCDEIVYFEYADAVETVRRAFVDRAWDSGTVAVELTSTTPSASVMFDLWAALGEVAADLVTGDWLVDDIRLQKSPAELERIERAGAMADTAMAALRDHLRPGITELQVSATLHLLLADAGSEIAANQPLVSSGPTAWRDIHAFPSHRPLEHGDTVTIDCCASVDRYHANLCRTFSIGEPHPRAVQLVDAGRIAIGEFCRLARAGDRPETAMHGAEAVLRSRVPDEDIWWIGGYGLGIGMPASWVGHTYLDNSGPTEITLIPGYVSNFETVLISEQYGFEAGSIDTLIVTEHDGARVLSALPQEILVVG